MSKLMGWLGPMLGTGASLLMQGANRNAQYNQQKKLQELQIKGQKELGHFNQQQAMDMWEKTNYSAQAEQMEKAGLSKALMYGGGGAGGATTQGGQAGAVTGGQADGEASRMMAQSQQAQSMAQLALLKAQKENIEADTENKKGDTGNTAEDTIAKQFDNDVRKGVGADSYIKQLDAQLTNEMSKNKNEYRQANALFEAMNQGDSDEIIKDHFGSYVAGNWEKLGEEDAKTLMSSWQRTEADLLKIKQDIASSEQGVKESISKEKLNEIDAKISDFKADLTKLGLNETTTRILELILKAWTAGRRK